MSTRVKIKVIDPTDAEKQAFAAFFGGGRPSGGATVPPPPTGDVVIPPPAPQPPPPSAGGTGGTTTQPTMPADPTHASPGPGTGASVPVPIGQLAKAVAAAQAGAKLVLDAGIYSETVGLLVPLLIDGLGSVANPGTATAQFSGGARLDGSTFTAYKMGKGGIVPSKDCIIKGLEISGFGLMETSAQSTSGVRPSDGCGYVTIDNCYVHDNQCGLGGGGIPFEATISDSIFLDNGIGDGSTHSIYVSRGCIRCTLTNVTSINHASVGVPTTQPTAPPATSPFNRATGVTGNAYPLKSRANVTTVTGGYFQASDAACMDFPDGSNLPIVITGAVLNKPAGSVDHKVVAYAEESSSNGTAGIQFKGCTFNLDSDGAIFFCNAGSMDFDSSCVFTGVKPVVRGGGIVTGLPV